MSKRIEKNEQSTTHKNAYSKWNDKADNQLCFLFHQGISIEQLSELFGRTKGAIRSRLKKLNVIQEDY
jgi:DNA-binding transcriptional regulator WhiA